MMASWSTTSAGSGFRTVLVRAIVFAAFVILLSLLGEAVLVLALSASKHVPVAFTTFWAFSLSSAMLGSFPLIYKGVPLGFGLSKIATGNEGIVMTRTKRLAIFLLYLLFVVCMGFVCTSIQQYEHVRNDVDVMFLFLIWFLLVCGITTVSEWRRL